MTAAIDAYPNAKNPNSPLDIIPVAGRIGAEIRDVQLSGDIDAPTVQAIEAAVVRHKVVFFRGQQHIDNEDHEAFTALFGDPGPVKEVGFHPIRVRDQALDTPLRHLVDVPILHWHGDTFTLPENVELLASSHVYDHQAFRRGRNILAVQFHAEMGEDERFNAWIEEWPESVQEAGGDEASLRAAHDTLGPLAVAAGQAMIAEWLQGLDEANWPNPNPKTAETASTFTTSPASIYRHPNLTRPARATAHW